MNTQLLLIFIILNIVNVVFQTIKSIATVKCGKLPAALVNAVTFGVYTVVLVYMVCELPLILKVAIVAACNFVGVFVVKWIEEKARREKLWKIEVTCGEMQTQLLEGYAKQHGVPYSIFTLNSDCGLQLMVFYCRTSKQTALVHEWIDKIDHQTKYFISESKSF